MKYVIAGCCLFVLYTQAIHAQLSTDDSLHIELMAMDALVFEKGYNECKLDVFDVVIHDDLEFYHDQGGVLASKIDFIKGFEQNICSNPDHKPIRKLEKESVKVYPMFQNGSLYAAIQMGKHTFHIKEPGKELYQTSEAEFIHLWVKEEGLWKLKRILSYDHH